MKKATLFSVLIILLGSLVNALVMVKSGVEYSYGMGFWGPNAHDGLWHVSLINQLAGFNFTHPTFSGMSLMNYHYGFDFLTGILHLVTRIPVLTLYFQILPIIFALGLGILVYIFSRLVFKSSGTIVWILFFTYFGGGLGFLVNLIKGEPLGGESVFWAIQPISFLINPPFMLSLIFIFSGLIFLFKFLTSGSKREFMLSSLFFGLLLITKVYAGLIVLSGLLLIGIFEKRIRKVFLTSTVISLVLFLPSNRNSASLVKLEPLWFPRTMMEFTDRVGWVRFANARRAYMESRNFLKWIPAETFAAVLFVLGNLGTRIIGFFSIKKTLNRFDKSSPSSLIQLLLIVFILISILPTLLFVQEGNPWNIIQFFYYAESFMAIFAGLAISQAKPITRAVIVPLIILFSLPTIMGTLTQYLPSRPPSAIPPDELKALHFLRGKPSGIVLTYPYDKNEFFKHAEPRPLYSYESTAYVSAISGHLSFLEDEVNLEISKYPWQERKSKILEVFSSGDNQKVKEFLETNNIKYVYHLTQTHPMAFGPEQVGLTQIFEIPHKVRIFEFNYKI